MEQERDVCRFCLEPRHSPANPFLAPCACTGSVRFVHRRCLYRWILRDLEDIPTHCELCHAPYEASLIPQLEIIPSGANIDDFFLNSSFSLAFLVNYLWIGLQVHSTIRADQVFFFNHWVAQSLVHSLYFTFFLSHFRVQNLRAYLRNSWKSYSWAVGAHAFLILLFWRGGVGSGITLGSYLSSYWRVHLYTLKKMNRRLALEMQALR
jgi:hypothetical protein